MKQYELSFTVSLFFQFILLCKQWQFLYFVYFGIHIKGDLSAVIIIYFPGQPSAPSLHVPRKVKLTG